MTDTNHQFPPSSPLLNESVDYNYDTFSHIGKWKAAEAETRQRDLYPTPNPSSATGRSSSPSRQHDFQQEKTKERTVRINKDFNVLDPDSEVLRVPLLPSKSNLLIGRSSKSCDFHVPAQDKTVSRVHLSVSYNIKQIILNCLGYNGLSIKIPRPLAVFSTNVENSYVMLDNENGAALDINDLEKFNYKPRTINLEANQTEFMVNRNESIILPRISNIMVEIRNHLILLNPEDTDEELTDDETPILIKPSNEGEKKTTSMKLNNKYNTPKSLYITSPTTPVKLNVPDEVYGSTPIKAKVDSENMLQRNDKSEMKSNHQNTTSTPQPLHKLELELNDKENFPQVEYKNGIFSTPKRSKTPLGNKTNLLSNPNTPNTTHSIARKAQSEEPPKRQIDESKKTSSVQKKRKKNQAQSNLVDKLRFDKSYLADIENIAEIRNILINHLAFSRLSSTPASFLNTISANTSKLSLTQIRALLLNTDCIGVIYREGKDAAGKPLEEEYYYIREKDEDKDRTKLVESIKGHGGLRACRRTHKQYYWRKPAPIKK